MPAPGAYAMRMRRARGARACTSSARACKRVRATRLSLPPPMRADTRRCVRENTPACIRSPTHALRSRPAPARPSRGRLGSPAASPSGLAACRAQKLRETYVLCGCDACDSQISRLNWASQARWLLGGCEAISAEVSIQHFKASESSRTVARDGARDAKPARVEEEEYARGLRVACNVFAYAGIEVERTLVLWPPKAEVTSAILRIVSLMTRR
eukprot:4189526-Pleurochrysis_carterae.AAC.1